MKKYDSELDTIKHMSSVRTKLNHFAIELIKRGECHDNSKLGDIEKPLFDKCTERLKSLTYGSKEYKDSLDELGIALKHHYENNRHHPQHFENGVNGMNLLDLVEMFFDWSAAVERHDSGDIFKSIEINKKRFGISEQLSQIFRNTAQKSINEEIQM